MNITTRCKSLLLGGLLCLSTCVLALPSPKDIEASVQAGQFDRAETQLREVLREKPSSARAHYELGQVLAREGRYFEAEQMLRQAQKLEPSLKFASSTEQFNQLLGRLEAKTRMPSTALSGDSAAPSSAALNTRAARQQAAPAQAQFTPSVPWGWLLLGGGALAALAVWIRRAATAQRIATAPSTSPLDDQGFGRSYGPAPAYPGPYQGVPAGTPAPGGGTGSGMGSTVTGAVVGGIAGVAAGYALSKMLEGEHHDVTPPRADNAAPPASFTRLDAVPDRPDFGAFDGGSGDGWDNADAGGADSDGW